MVIPYRRLLIFCSTFATVVADTKATPSPVPTSLVRRADPSESTAVPIVTLGPIEGYITPKSTYSQPSGDKLQIYPTGIYNDFPDDGITVAFGPDLVKRMEESMGDNCQQDTNACRDRIIPILHNTDIETHSKRFPGLVPPIGSFLILAAIVAEIYIWGDRASTITLNSVSLPYPDLVHMHEISWSDIFAIEEDTDENPATITIPAMSATTTSRGQNFITIETLTADAGDRKTGDFIYHIPVNSARRIQNYLAITARAGFQEATDKCKGVDVYKPNIIRGRQPGLAVDTADQCRRLVQRYTPIFMKGIPESSYQLAPEDYPVLSDPFDFPIQNFMTTNGVYSVPVASVYHLMDLNLQNGETTPAAPRSQYPSEIDIPTLVKSTVAFTILMQAAMADGEMALEIWVPQTAVKTDLKEGDFLCPTDLLCTSEDCGAQEDDEEILERNAICKTDKYENCKCQRVMDPRRKYVKKGDVEAQYEFDPQCTGTVQEDPKMVELFKKTIKGVCSRHPTLPGALSETTSNGAKFWTDSGDKIPGVAWSFEFKTTSNSTTTCPFDCDAIFGSFANSTNCIKDTGVVANGTIQTDCGTANYHVQKTGKSLGGRDDKWCPMRGFCPMDYSSSRVTQ